MTFERLCKLRRDWTDGSFDPPAKRTDWLDRWIAAAHAVKGKRLKVDGVTGWVVWSVGRQREVAA